jgi:large subunit ribosomal protein L19
MEKIPEIKPGDLIKVYTKIIEGDKSRIAAFQGLVIQTRGSGVSKTFTVRKISAGVGIERIFPLHSPLIAKIEIKKKGKVRKAKLSYLRHKQARKMKIRKTTPDKGGPTEETTPQDEAAEAEEVNKTEEQHVEGTPGEKTVEKV